MQERNAPPLPPLTRPPLVLFESFFCPPVLPLHALKSAFVPCCSCFSCLAVLFLLAGSPLHCCSSACQSLNPVLLFLCSDCVLLAPFACCLASMSFCLFPACFFWLSLFLLFHPFFTAPLRANVCVCVRVRACVRASFVCVCDTSVQM